MSEINSIQRRDFLKQASAGSAVAATAINAANSDATEASDVASLAHDKKQIILHKVQITAFLPHLDTEFWVTRVPDEDAQAHIHGSARSTKDAFRVVLDDAKLIGPKPLPPGVRIKRNPFALYFKASLDTEPVQGIFQLQHEHFAPFSVFMVPLRRTEDSIVLQAVFN